MLSLCITGLLNEFRWISIAFFALPTSLVINRIWHQTIAIETTIIYVHSQLLNIRCNNTINDVSMLI
jgi:hypothetical protein